jgi:uncharacterized lipoprotein NlpE involved in copper resistance
MISFRIVMVLSVLWFAVSCKNGPEYQVESLYGKWEVEKAEKNGRETPYLRGGYFQFDDDGSMTMNITGEDEMGTYTLHQGKINFRGEKEFSIEMLVDDTLKMSYKAASDADFMFYLTKTAHEK